MENQKEKKKNKKILILILLFSIAAIILTGAILAYFSDALFGGGTVTTGTLDLTGNYVFYVNGTETAAEAVTNLNPGDVITLSATVTNEGNKSAWVREVVTFNADPAVLPFLSVYNGVFDQEQFQQGGVDEGARLTLTDGKAVSAVRVLNGMGSDAETESGGGFTYINSNTYTVAITVYFDAAATNAAQGKNITLSAVSQALQFRNNNAAEPDEAAWETVAAL